MPVYLSPSYLLLTFYLADLVLLFGVRKSGGHKVMVHVRRHAENHAVYSWQTLSWNLIFSRLPLLIDASFSTSICIHCHIASHISISIMHTSLLRPGKSKSIDLFWSSYTKINTSFDSPECPVSDSVWTLVSNTETPFNAQFSASKPQTFRSYSSFYYTYMSPTATSRLSPPNQFMPSSSALKIGYTIEPYLAMAHPHSKQKPFKHPRRMKHVSLSWWFGFPYHSRNILAFFSARAWSSSLSADKPSQCLFPMYTREASREAVVARSKCRHRVYILPSCVGNWSCRRNESRCRIVPSSSDAM